MYHQVQGYSNIFFAFQKMEVTRPTYFGGLNRILYPKVERFSRLKRLETLKKEGCEASILKPFFLLWWLHCQELWFIFFLCETAQTVKLTSPNESSVEWSTHRWSLLKKSSERSFKRRLSLGFSVRFSSRMYRPAGGWILKSFVETPAFMAGDLCRWPRTRWAGWYGFLSPVVLLLWLVFSFILH